MSLKFYLSISFCLFFMWLYTLIKCDELPKYESLWITNKTINALSSIIFFIFQILVPKTHILIKREYEDEELSEYDNLQLYEKVDYLTGILKGGILYAGDRSGSMKVEITNEEIKNYYFWKYID